MADNSGSPLSTKQKVIGAVTIVIFGFIIYEVIGMFSSGTPAETTVPTPSHTAAVPARQAGTANPASTATMTTMQTNTQPGVPAAVNVITPTKDISELQKQQQQQQQAYLDTVNQLQLLKVKKEIAETNQAIATARLATETANKNMSDLLTQPTMPSMPSGQTGTVGNLIGKLPGTTNGSGTEVPIIKPQGDVPFTVISISMKFNRWGAVLRYQDKLFSVSIGDSLFDGSMVVGINKNSVTLSKDGKRRKLPIQTAI